METTKYWPISGVNSVAREKWVGVGFAKMVYRAQIDANGYLPTDANGNVQFIPEKEIH
jgi:hypothetical protein